MTQPGKLTLRALALSVALVAAPAAAPAWADEAQTAGHAASRMSADPHMRRAEGEPAPQERRTPPPAAPTGCPFRNGKLELIA